MTTVVPADVALAARRGFVRTTYQAYAATLSTGLPSAAAIVAFVQDDSPAKWIVAGVTVALALASPPLAGLRSYLDITSKGIPEDYKATPLAPGVELTDDEARMVRDLRLVEGRDPHTGAPDA